MKANVIDVTWSDVEWEKKLTASSEKNIVTESLIRQVIGGYRLLERYGLLEEALDILAKSESENVDGNHTLSVCFPKSMLVEMNVSDPEKFGFRSQSFNQQLATLWWHVAKYTLTPATGVNGEFNRY